MRKIFISSTFRDMQAERDAIHTVVVPQLRVIARQYGEDVDVCDLRWGINTGDLDGEDGAKKVLSVCMDEIDKCKPFMLVVLGERYGWIPGSELLENAVSRKNYQLEEMEKSVTALEIEYGALDDEETLRRSIFMFREPMLEASMEYQSEGEDHGRRLRVLKERIQKLSGGRIFYYRLKWDSEKQIPTGLESFTQIVTEQLRLLLEQEWKEYEQLHENQKEEKRHWEFAEKKSGQFGGRNALIENCREKLEHGQGILMLAGEAGCGKSTLWSKLVTDYRNQGWNVFPFVCGNTSQSVSAMDIIRQWIFYVEGLLGIEHFENQRLNDCMMQREKGDESDWNKRLWAVLEMYCAREENPKLLLAADGLDQLNYDKQAENFEFLPIFREKKVYFLLSCLQSYNRERYEGDCILVQSMTQQEKIEVLRGMLSYQRKELDKDVMEKIIKKRGTDNPLYMSLLVQRLAIMDKNDFSVIAEYGNNMQAISRHQSELICQAPEEVEEMCRMLVLDTGNQINRDLVTRAAEYIAVSRQGLRERDLKELLEMEGIQWSSLDFSRAVHYMPMLFTERSNGQIDFTHQTIRVGLCRYVNKERMCRNIFVYLKTLSEEDELRMNEMIHYCYVLDEKEYLLEYIGKGQASSLKKAAHELYWICMRDKGRWFVNVLQREKSQYETNMVDFILQRFEKVFVEGSMNELETKLNIYRNVLKTCKKIFEEQKTLKSMQDYVVSCNNVIQIYEKQGNLEEAWDLCDEGLTIAMKLYEEQKTLENICSYFVSLCNAGDIYGRLEGGLEGAQNFYEEGLVIAKKLYKEQRTLESMNDYSISCDRIGSIYEQQGNLEKAQGYIRKAYLIKRNLCEKQRTPKNMSDYSISCDRIGSIYEKQGNFGKAKAMYEESMSIRKKLYEEQRTSENMRNYSLSCNKMGDIYVKRENLEKALEKYEESRNISTSLYRKLKTPQSVRDLTLVGIKISNIYEKQGKLKDALVKCGMGPYIIEKLYEKQQGMPDINTMLVYSASMDMEGNIYEKQGNLGKAQEKYEKSIIIKKKLYEGQRTQENMQNYSVSCNKMGDIYTKLGKLEKAKAMYEESIVIKKK